MRGFLHARLHQTRSLTRMSKPDTPRSAERSRRAARLEKLTVGFEDPFHLTQSAKTHSAREIKERYAALPASQRTSDTVKVAGRFETFVNEWEIANAFSELNDPREHDARLLDQASQASSVIQLRP